MNFRFLFLPLLTVGLLSAQPGPRPHDGGGRAANFLDLTDTQKSQIKTIRESQKTAIEAARTQLETLHTNLIAAIKANSTGQIDSITLQMAPFEQQISAIRAKSAAQIYALLTADQKTKIGDHLQFLLGGPGGPADSLAPADRAVNKTAG